MLTNYLFKIVNEDLSSYKLLDKQTIKRTKLFGFLMHIPIILWFVLGYFLSQQLFNEVSGLTALLSGLICSLFIYLIDLAIISDRKVTIKKIIFRFILAIVVAILGALLVDTFIFEKDINRYIKTNQEIVINNDFNIKKGDQRAAISSAKSDWLKAEKNAACEGNGQCGSSLTNREELKILFDEKKRLNSLYVSKRKGALDQYKVETKNCGLWCSQAPIDDKYNDLVNQMKQNETKEINLLDRKINSINNLTSSGKPGIGPIYNELRMLANKLKAKFENQQDQFGKIELNNEIKLQNLNYEINNHIGLIEKIKILHKIIFEEPISILFSSLFFTLFLILELILLFTKWGSIKTISDYWEDHEEKIAIARIKIAENKLIYFEKAAVEGYQGSLMP